MRDQRRSMNSRLQSLEAALTPKDRPSDALWLLKGETVEEGVERYHREGIALTKPFLPVFPSMSKEEWLAEFGGGEWAEARLRKATSARPGEGTGSYSIAMPVS